MYSPWLPVIPAYLMERDLVRSSFLSFAELDERIKKNLFFLFFLQSHSNNPNFIAFRTLVQKTNKEIFLKFCCPVQLQVVCLFLTSTSWQRSALYKTYRQNVFNLNTH